jgi:Domain of unknown function (DUF4115)
MRVEWSAMVVALMALVVLAVVAGVAVLARRSGHDELHSVRSYHAAVGTMERLPSRATAVSPSPRRTIAVDDPEGETDDGVGRRVPTGPGGRVGGGRVVPPARLVFDDAVPIDPSSHLAASGSPFHRRGRSRDPALEAMSRRGRSGTSVVAVMVLVLLVGALVYIGVHHSSNRPSAASHPSHAANTAPAATRGSGHTATGHTGAAGRAAASKRRKTQTVTPPTPAQLTSVTSTATTATYAIGSSSFSITVHAAQTCWVGATAQPAGTLLWEGLLQPGGSKSIAASGTTVVVLGAAGASMTVNGVPVVIPTPSGTPFTATFQPSAT